MIDNNANNKNENNKKNENNNFDLNNINKSNKIANINVIIDNRKNYNLINKNELNYNLNNNMNFKSKSNDTNNISINNNNYIITNYIINNNENKNNNNNYKSSNYNLSGDYNITNANNKSNKYNISDGYNLNNEYNINSQIAPTQEKAKNTKKELEPESNFKLSEFVIIGEVGHGTEGVIYSVRWTKNNKEYALKKGRIYTLEVVTKRQEEIKMLKDFRKRTGSDGVIRIYGDLCVDSIDGYDFYEIMELAEIDWDEEILFRGKYHYYYQENELMAIMKQIVETFSLLQKNHITHRDIKPQNIMIVDGKFKICDFGNARILKKEGYVIQRIRGSEMYMSPVLFKGFHAKMPQVKHNTFKSDVFSLGMCFLLASALSYSPLNTIREIYDMNIIKKVIKHYLGNRYSQKIYFILISMLQVEENLRPDFIELEKLFI